MYAVLSYDDKTPFPSIYALVPTLGTALVILCARPATHIGQLLGTKPLVAIGLISYSAYLWHPPLFAFARHHGAAGRSTEVLVALCAVTLFLAYFTWVFVETPFRKKNLVSRRHVFQIAICGAVLFIAVGLAGHVSQGFESAWLSRKSESELLAFRLLKEERAHNEHMALRGADLPAGVDCRFNVPNLTAEIAERLKSCHTRYGEGVAVIGDSHAIDLYAAIATANEHLRFLVGFTRGYCRPHTALPECQYEQVHEFVRQHRVFSVVLYEQAGFYLLRTKFRVAERKIFSDVPSWGHVTGVHPNEPFVEATHRYLHALSQFVPVTWFGPRVEPHFDESDIIRLGCRHDYRLRPGQAEAFADLDRYLKRRLGGAGRLRYVSQNEMLSFTFPDDFMTCDRIYWADGDHFSRAGEEYFGRRLDMPRLLSRDSAVAIEIGTPVSDPFTGTRTPVGR